MPLSGFSKDKEAKEGNEAAADAKEPDTKGGNPGVLNFT